MNIAAQNIPTEQAEALREVFESQRQAYLAHPEPNYAERVADLKQLRLLVSENIEDLVAAINQDYGNRSRQETLFAEVLNTLDSIDHSLKHLKKWMRVQKRRVDMMSYPGAKNRVMPQPLGVVGLIIPWNFPLFLCFAQLSCAFAAGNRAVAKMSENSITLSRLLIELSPKYFPENKLQFLEETGGVGVEFSKLPFDLLVFTGSGQTGKAVMASAAQNLTPVVLELGGKAPAVIDPTFDLATAVRRILMAKRMNAGQICTNVDYAFVHESQREAFIATAREWAATHLTDINAADYTSLIDDRAMRRIHDTLEDARSKGATIIDLCPGQEPNFETRKYPMQLVFDTTPDMIIRQRETFGPLLMVMDYREPEDVINYVNSGERPLALYPFTDNKALAERYIQYIMSGGVSVNDALFHAAQADMPFGGVGHSGMGHYHGDEGFFTFSKLRPIFYQAKFSVAGKLVAPPYSDRVKKLFEFMVRMKK